MSDWDGKISKMSFSGCGFRGSYHLGVIQCFRDKGRSVLDQVDVFSGCSAGGLCAAIALMECPIKNALNFMRQMVREINSNFFGVFRPSLQLVKHLRNGIDFIFPEHAHKLANGRLHLSVTHNWRNLNKVITQFDTRDEFINALLATCYIPGYMGVDCPTYKGEQFVDGGFTKNLLYADHLGTLTISPMSGEFDICPKDPYDGRFNAGCYHLVGHKLDFSYFNLTNVYRGLIPTSEKAIDELYIEGYQDALRFLYSQRFTEEYSVQQTIPLPPTCPVLAYSSEGSTCVDEDEAFLKSQNSKATKETNRTSSRELKTFL